jgi:predicted permease
VEITTVLSSVIKMAIIILFGMNISKTCKMTDESKQLLVTIIINVAVPSIILNGIFNIDINDKLLTKMLTIFLISIFFNLIGIGLGWLSALIFGFRSIVASKMAILSGLGNTGFIGIPVCVSLFGSTGGLLAALYDSGLDVILFTLGTVLLKRNEKFSFKSMKEIINIPLISILIGITIAIIGYKPPLIVKSLATTLSSLAAPLAMLYIGLLIPTFFKEKKVLPLRFVSITLLMKLLVIPLIMIFVLQKIPITMDVKLIALIQVSMPTFMLATVLFARYDQDDDTAVITTVYSTFFSLVTIPIIAYTANLILYD